VAGLRCDPIGFSEVQLPVHGILEVLVMYNDVSEEDFRYSNEKANALESTFGVERSC
jgi:hypothetical protein